MQPKESHIHHIALLETKSVLQCQSFEYMECLLKSHGNWIRLIILYRPPPSAKNKFTVGTFMTEFTCLLEKLAIATGELVMFGDFNFHIDTCKPDALQFLNLLDNFGLKQHVMEKTHTCGHTLGLVITRASENIINNSCNMNL